MIHIYITDSLRSKPHFIYVIIIYKPIEISRFFWALEVFQLRTPPAQVDCPDQSIDARWQKGLAPCLETGPCPLRFCAAHFGEILAKIRM